MNQSPNLMLGVSREAPQDLQTQETRRAGAELNIELWKDTANTHWLRP